MAIHASDGDLGRIEEFYFDDERWTVRYLIARTGSWLAGRHVLLPPAVIKAVDWLHHAVVVSLTTDQVRESPPIDTAKPVSRVQEVAYLNYFNLSPYWGLTGLGPGPVMPLLARADAARDEAAGVPPPTRLRSSKEVTGYRLEATDGPIGTLADFILDEDSWGIVYLAVKTDGGPEVVLPPEWIERVSWGEQKLYVAVDARAVRDSPAYQDTMQLTPAYDAALERHYGRPRVWK